MRGEFQGRFTADTSKPSVYGAKPLMEDFEIDCSEDVTETFLFCIKLIMRFVFVNSGKLKLYGSISNLTQQ